jgi:hypothetical protein
MKMRRSLPYVAALSLGFVGGALLAANAQAQVAPGQPSKYTYSYTKGQNQPGLYIDNGYGSKIQSFNLSYDLWSGKRLSLDVTMDRMENVYDDGFWMVLNNGGNPKGLERQLAILYGDLRSNKITVYAYNGMNSASSFQSSTAQGINSPILIGTFDMGGTLSNRDPFSFTGVNNGRATGFRFDLDFSAVNDRNALMSMHVPGANRLLSNWSGAAFGDQVGIWYHPVSVLKAHYNGDALTSFDANSHKGGVTGWFDSDALKTRAFCPNGSAAAPAGSSGARCATTPSRVPEPGTLVLMGAGLIGLGIAANRRKANPAATA